MDIAFFEIMVTKLLKINNPVFHIIISTVLGGLFAILLLWQLSVIWSLLKSKRSVRS